MVVRETPRCQDRPEMPDRFLGGIGLGNRKAKPHLARGFVSAVVSIRPKHTSYVESVYSQEEFY